jgi:hypothetical protein
MSENSLNLGKPVNSLYMCKDIALQEKGEKLNA